MSGNTYFEDLAIAIAIDDINKDNNLLQNITVGMKRFSDCGAYYPQVEHYNGGFTGLVGTEVVNNVVSNNDVIGVIGAEFSSAIVISAEEFSLHEIPYCSALIGSPRFSDKNKYPFFFRTFASMTGFGQIIFQLLDVWNVKRVALIVQKDDEVGLASGRDMRRFLERNGIIILADLQLSSNIDKLTYARYFIVSGQPLFCSAVAYNLGKRGLVSKKHVWISYSEPQAFGDPLTIYGPDYYNLIEGFIYTQAVTPSFQNERFISVLSELNQRTGVGMSPSDFGFNFMLQCYYDCVMIMAHGLDKLMKSNASFTPEMLGNRQLQSHMNYKLFQDVGYSGISSTNMMLSDSGDLLLPFQFFYFSGDYYNVTAFGQTNSQYTNFSYYSDVRPRFYGGISIPPPDGPSRPISVSYSISSFCGQFIVSAAFVGVAFSSFAVSCLLYFHNHKLVKSKGIPESVVQLLGCMLLYISIIFYIPVASRYTCHIRQWLFIIGYNMIITTMCMKRVFLAFILQIKVRSRDVKRIQGVIHCSLVVLAAVSVLLSQRNAPISVQTIYSAGYMYQKCIPSKNHFAFLPEGVSIFFSIAVLSTQYIQVKVRQDELDESIANISCLGLISLAYLLVKTTDRLDLNGDFKQSIYTFAIVTLFIFVSFGARFYLVLNELHFEKLVITLSRLKTQVAQQVSSKLKSTPQSTLARRGMSVDYRNGFQRRAMNTIIANCLCKWSDMVGWRRVAIEIICVESRVWIMLAQGTVQCYRIVNSTTIDHVGAFICIHTKLEHLKYEILFELENEVVAHKLHMELLKNISELKESQ